MCVNTPSPSFKWEELWGSGTDLGRERPIHRTDDLMDSVLIRCAFDVARKLTSKVGDQRYDLTLGIIRGGCRELGNLGVRFVQ